MPENEPTRRQWFGFWSMIVQQTQNAFNDKLAQFTLIPLGGAVGFAVESWAGLMIAMPFVLFAPLAGWVSDRFSKRDVMLGAAISQVLILGWICGSVWMKNLPFALIGFFALATQSAFYSPAKIGSNKELVGSKHLGFAAGIQQMTAMLAILCGQIVAGGLFDHQFAGHGGAANVAWHAALVPLLILTACSLPALGLAWAVPRVPAKGGVKFSGGLLVSHFANLADLWRDGGLRRASFGIAFFWGFAAFINLWSVKMAKAMTGGGDGFGTLSSEFMAAASLGMAGGFGFASFLLRKRIELGWVPVAGMAMTASAVTLAFLVPGGWPFLFCLGLLAFFAAIFLAPLNAWVQDRYPADKRGELQAAVNLQDCFAGIIAVALIASCEFAAAAMGLDAALGFRIQMVIIGLICLVATISIVRTMPGDLIRLVGVAIIRSIYRIKTVNADRVPTQGGVLLLPNHVTFADAFFISAACPRPVRFVMDEAFMKSAAIRAFVSVFDTMTIRRDQPLEAIRRMIKALKDGDVVCLFPEGQLTRTGTLSELQRGFELTAKKAGHPLIPMWCDGSWGSIFSFERGRFFRKKPYQLPYGMSIAFGEEIEPAEANLDVVRQRMLEASASALAARFEGESWGSRIPSGDEAAVAKFRLLPEIERRRIWMNGHQIGQVNALQRRKAFAVLKEDAEVLDLLGLCLAFPALYDAELVVRESIDGRDAVPWVGGDALRERIENQPDRLNGFVFYDFSKRAHQPLSAAGVVHFPCLSIGGRVVAMSMENPPPSEAGEEPQHGHKAGSWGKLLPGFFIKAGRVHGPAAPPEGLELPASCRLDAAGFLGVAEEELRPQPRARETFPAATP